MNLQNVEENVKLLTTSHGDEVLYINEMPVAGYSSIEGWWKLEGKYTKHISEYLKGAKLYNIITIEELENMFALENRQ